MQVLLLDEGAAPSSKEYTQAHMLMLELLAADAELPLDAAVLCAISPAAPDASQPVTGRDLRAMLLDGALHWARSSNCFDTMADISARAARSASIN